VLTFFQQLPPCLVGIEACASSHHWSRGLQALGHTVRLMPPAYVKPYTSSGRCRRYWDLDSNIARRHIEAPGNKAFHRSRSPAQGPRHKVWFGGLWPDAFDACGDRMLRSSALYFAASGTFPLQAPYESSAL
jgi:hypothetical protein